MDKVQMARQFIEAIPHARDLGLKLIELENGVAVITMPTPTRRAERRPLICGLTICAPPSRAIPSPRPRLAIT